METRWVGVSLQVYLLSGSSQGLASGWILVPPCGWIWKGPRKSSPASSRMACRTPSFHTTLIQTAGQISELWSRNQRLWLYPSHHSASRTQPKSIYSSPWQRLGAAAIVSHLDRQGDFLTGVLYSPLPMSILHRQPKGSFQKIRIRSHHFLYKTLQWLVIKFRVKPKFPSWLRKPCISGFLPSRDLVSCPLPLAFLKGAARPLPGVPSSTPGWLLLISHTLPPTMPAQGPFLTESVAEPLSVTWLPVTWRYCPARAWETIHHVMGV